MNLRILLLALLVMLLAAGCDSRKVTASSYHITVTCDPNTIEVGSELNSSTVEAVVTRMGESVADVQVNFSTDFGSILSSGITNMFGVAETTFWYDGNLTGEAVIKARFAGAEDETTIFIVDEFPYELTVWSEPEEIYLGSGNYSTNVYAWLKDRDGFGVRDAEISFIATEGFVSPEAITNQNGIAEAAYIFSGEEETTIELTASYQSGAAVTNIEVIENDVIVLSLWADRDSIYVGTNENYTEVYARLLDGYGNPLPERSVQFSSNIGSMLDYGITNEMGIANSTFWYDERPDMIAVIQASYAGEWQTVEVNILTNQPQIESVEADPLMIFADNDMETFSLITVRVFDSVGSPMPNQQVTFETGLGYLVQPFAVTDDDGYATTQFHDNGIYGYATVYIYCANDTSQITIEIAEEEPARGE